MNDYSELSTFTDGLQHIVLSMICGATLLVGLALIGKANRNVSGKVKHRAEHALRKGVRHIGKHAEKERDDDLADNADFEITRSYLRNFSQDVARGCDVLLKGCCKQSRRKPKLL